MPWAGPANQQSQWKQKSNLPTLEVYQCHNTTSKKRNGGGIYHRQNMPNHITNDNIVTPPCTPIHAKVLLLVFQNFKQNFQPILMFHLSRH